MNILPLKINNLNYRVDYKDILKDINLFSDEEKVTIIAGNNGSGKTTFLKILHGLINTPKHTIKWGNYSATEVKKNQSMVFQTPILLNRTTHENLTYVANKKNIVDNNYVKNSIVLNPENKTNVVLERVMDVNLISETIRALVPPLECPVKPILPFDLGWSFKTL